METDIGGLLTLEEINLLRTVLQNDESVLLDKNLKSYKLKKHDDQYMLERTNLL